MHKKVVKKFGIKDEKIYTLVKSGGCETYEYIASGGSQLTILEIGASAAYVDSVWVEIIYNTDVILATHGDFKRNVDFIVNNGEKLKIKLHNQSGKDYVIGGYFKGEIKRR